MMGKVCGVRQEITSLCDAEIRPALRSQIMVDYGHEPDSLLIEELGLCRGQARVDLALVNGHFHGFEIKSDRDSLRRLNGQIEIYNRVFDHMTMVVGARHLTEVLEYLPPWWGILQIVHSFKGLKFKSRRKGRKNPARDPRALAELLWLDEAIALLEQRDAARGVRGKPRRKVWDRVCECYTLNEIAGNVRARLKARITHQVPAPPS
jgi:hypothetical protein